ASVRGYHQAQQLGDHGVNVSVELYTPAWRRDGLPDSLRALAFVDWGYLWVVQHQRGTAGHFHLASAGVGLRAQILRHLAGELDWSYPLVRQGTVDPGQQRVDFRVAYEF
ncbi:MAG: ShlB/FhaC/HecB family hemolysin secretion/activation protein, partial [Methylococcaceae bacterium]|nr:ShlB/FhaC/HecB family hemolysin secretion/activation protein [Methylococcaceae bacterium]